MYTKKRVIAGIQCSPAAKTRSRGKQNTCFSIEQLKHIAKTYNQKIKKTKSKHRSGGLPSEHDLININTTNRL